MLVAHLVVSKTFLECSARNLNNYVATCLFGFRPKLLTVCFCDKLM